MIKVKSTISAAASTSGKSQQQQVRARARGSVYEEGMELLIGAVIIYIFAELRDMIREGTIEDLTLQDLEPPLTATRMLEVIQTHKDALKERAVDHEYLESRLQTLQQAYEQGAEAANQLSSQAAEERQEAEQTHSSAFCSPKYLLDLIFCGGGEQNSTPSKNDTTAAAAQIIPSEAETNAIVLKQFVDVNSKEEIVHGIVVNPFKKRITIVFRGSVTNKDFLQDAKCAQKQLDNPVLGLLSPTTDTTTATATTTEEEMPSKIRIHTGFYEYLFYKNKENADKTRLEEILEETKKLLRNEYKGYSLYMTGHSLGGALSTLCGFYAACDEELIQLAANHRVVVYSIASPFVGNWKFRHAFQDLERRRRLQHVRIANREDMITLLPFAVPKATFLSPALSMVQGAGNLYKHVGIKVQLKKVLDDSGKEVVEQTIQYPKENQCDNDQDFAKEVQDAMDAGKSLIKAIYHLCKSEFSTVEKYHSCDEYEQRFESCRTLLGNKTLDDLYNDTGIVGKLFAQDYRLNPLPKSGITRAFRAFTVLAKRDSKKDNGSTATESDDEEEMTLAEAAMASPQ
jgi:hypothetical protein